MAVFFYDMPIGKIGIEEIDGFVTRIWKVTESSISYQNIYETSLIAETKEQLEEYFAGKRKDFSIPINPQGSNYMKDVWTQLRKIPYGKVLSYSDIAALVGNRKGARSVGMACGKNPILVLIPCHRVIGSNGSLTGFSCGLETKLFLLKLEGIYSFVKDE